MSKVKKVWATLHILFRAITLLITSAPLYAVCSLGISIASGLTVPIILLLSQRFLDCVAESLQNGFIIPTMFYYLVGIFFISIIQSLLSTIGSNTRQGFSEKLSIKITDMVFGKVTQLPMATFDNQSTYNTIKIAAEETPGRCMSLIEIMSVILQSLLQLLGIAALVISLHWSIAVLALLASLPIFFINCHIGKKLFNIQKKRMEGIRLIDTLKTLIVKNDNVKELKLFNLSGLLTELILSKQESYHLENKRVRKHLTALNFLSYSIEDIISLILKIIVVSLSIIAKKSIGTITMLISALDQFTSSFQTILGQVSSLYEQSLYLQYVFDLQDISIPDESQLQDLDGKIETIEFENVSFRYPGSKVNVIDNCSFVMESGKTYALIGINGSGKTTMIKLLLRLYSPDKGNIYINGVDVKLIKTASIMKRFSAVFQDFIRFPLSVGDNIAYGKQDSANFDDIAKAASFSTADAFIRNLPEQYDTQLQREWSGGTELSGGEWQKIAISRCIVKRSDIYIFDELFSALDAFSEAAIMQKLEQLKEGRICVFVTHRYSSVSLADHIFVLDNGSLVESGTHSELMTIDSGIYNRLYTTQIEPIKSMEYSAAQ